MSDEWVHTYIFTFINITSCLITAPGQYRLDRSGTIILGHSPKYTFGLKTQIEKPNDTPGILFYFSLLKKSNLNNLLLLLHLRALL